MSLKEQHFETVAIHGSEKRDPAGSHKQALHRTTAYKFSDSADAADLFGLKKLGHIYGRLSNPTQEVLEERLALLENGGKAGAHALALSSGTSAVFYSIINLAQQGDNIVSSSNLYGGTYTMLDAILPQFGITTSFVPPHDIEALKKSITPKTRALFAETIGNPTLDVVDLSLWSRVAHEHNIPLIVDATFTTPYLCRPFDFGVDIVVHSLTKWIGGQGSGLGGVVIDSNRFDWSKSNNPLYNEPDGGYHGLRFGHDLGGLPPYIIRMRTIPLRNLGACISADNAWSFLNNLETLAVRMDRHCSNSLEVAKFLEKDPRVAWVNHPGLESHPSHDLAKKQFTNGYGAMVVFGLKNPQNKDIIALSKQFVDDLKLFSIVANVGDTKSLALHAASTTHSQLSAKQQIEAGLRPDLIRLSIGLENINDILGDLEQALAKVK